MTPNNAPCSGILTAAVLPLKSLKNSKQRLAPVLDPQQRAELSLAMLKDILHTLAQCRGIDKIFIVTNDPAVKNLAESTIEHAVQHPPIELLAEPQKIQPAPDESGLINAITHAGKVLAKRNIQRMIFIPADVPLVSPEEIQKILNPVFDKSQPPHGVLNIVPASESGGSNCISCMPPDCMNFSFGDQSFTRHIRIARHLNLTTITTPSPGLGLDIDTPEDLTQLAKRLLEKESDLAAHAHNNVSTSTHSHTYQFLSSHRILNTLPPVNRAVESIRLRN